MQIDPTPLSGCKILTPRRFGDARGWFSETWNAARMAGAGIDQTWVQDNQSYSAEPGTLRGLHYQSPPRAQAKLVRCTRGAVSDVAVDIRTGSPTYGKWFAVELSADNGRQHFLPTGFLHGFVTLTSHVEIQYKCSDFFSPDHDLAVRWNDPAIGIDWGTLSPILSHRDATAPLLAQIGAPFRYEAGT